MRPMRSTRTYSRCSGVVIVAMVFLWQQSAPNLLAQSANPQANKIPALDVIVLEGEGGVNIIKTKKAVMPVVEVRDKERRLVPGLYVTFAAPNSGPRVTFAHGSSTYSTVTDANGRATVSEIRPVGEGAFKINVTATLHGQTASATIAQTNYLTLAAAGVAAGGTETPPGVPTAAPNRPATTAKHGISKTLIAVIIAGVAAGAGAAVALGKGGGGSSTSSTSTSPSGTIGGASPPTIGAPH